MWLVRVFLVFFFSRAIHYLGGLVTLTGLRVFAGCTSQTNVIFYVLESGKSRD